LNESLRFATREANVSMLPVVLNDGIGPQQVTTKSTCRPPHRLRAIGRPHFKERPPDLPLMVEHFLERDRPGDAVNRVSLLHLAAPIAGPIEKAVRARRSLPPGWVSVEGQDSMLEVVVEIERLSVAVEATPAASPPWPCRCPCVTHADRLCMPRAEQLSGESRAGGDDSPQDSV
jgi:hypothetical protein